MSPIGMLHTLLARRRFSQPSTTPIAETLEFTAGRFFQALSLPGGRTSSSRFLSVSTAELENTVRGDSSRRSLSLDSSSRGESAAGWSNAQGGVRAWHVPRFGFFTV